MIHLGCLIRLHVTVKYKYSPSGYMGCIRSLATKIFKKSLVASTRTPGRDEEMQLSSGWALIWLELSSPNFNSSVRAERLSAIGYLNVVIKPLHGNLDICLNYCFRSRNSVRMLGVADRNRKWKMLHWIALFGRTLEQFSRFRERMHLLPAQD